ncbi:hypothetical protein [Arthrobacter sp. TMN-50]
MTGTHTISKSITVENAAHLDEVTVHLEVDCPCTAASGSYTRSQPARR